MIEPLFEKSHYEISINQPILITKRIGQYSILKLIEDENGGKQSLEKIFTGKKQWDLRKAESVGFKIQQESSEKTLFELYLLHRENMQFLGGREKPYSVFESIMKNFDAEKDYKVYIARYNEDAVAALLLFCFENQIEYFVPAVKFEFRSSQVLSLLIFEAMQEHVYDNNQVVWNWGGTWPSQEGVYNFKKSWNAISREYHYHTLVIKTGEIIEKMNSQLFDSYEFFYLFPVEKDKI
jgi:lipid II:glycine glycyltransferase (peptidoglycan interpeptide bridge formation enzyme)